MKFCALVSGGKDSIYTILECVRLGHELVCIAHLSLASKSSTEGDADSYMYQTVGGNGVKCLADLLGVPYISRVVRGSSRDQSLLFDASVIEEETSAAPALPTPPDAPPPADPSLPPLPSLPAFIHPNDEVADLFLLLADVVRRFANTQTPVVAVSSGAILSTYQRARVEAICAAFNPPLTSLAPLWERPQALLLHSMARAGVDARIVKVASYGLRIRDMGRSILEKDMQKRLTADPSMLHPCGEGGEYETFVVGCEELQRRLSMSAGHAASRPRRVVKLYDVKEVVRCADMWSVLAHLEFKTEVVDVEPSASAGVGGGGGAAIGDVTDDDGDDDDDDEMGDGVEGGPRAIAAEVLKQEVDGWEWGCPPATAPAADRDWSRSDAVTRLQAVWDDMMKGGVVGAADGSGAAGAGGVGAAAAWGGGTYIAPSRVEWGVTFVRGGGDAGVVGSASGSARGEGGGATVSVGVHPAAAAASAALTQVPAWVFKQAVYVLVFVKSMSSFAHVNGVYVRHFPQIQPAARACVEVPRMGGCEVAFVITTRPVVASVGGVSGGGEGVSQEAVGGGGERSESGAVGSDVLARLQLQRGVLHVQSISGWAPACVGPYAQAVSVEGPLVVSVPSPPPPPPTTSADALGSASTNTPLATTLVPFRAAVAAAAYCGGLSARRANVATSRTIALSGTIPLHPPTMEVLPVLVQPVAVVRHLETVLQERTTVRAALCDVDVFVVWGTTRAICAATAQVLFAAVVETAVDTEGKKVASKRRGGAKRTGEEAVGGEEVWGRRRCAPAVVCAVVPSLPKGVSVEVQAFGHVAARGVEVGCVGARGGDEGVSSSSDVGDEHHSRGGGAVAENEVPCEEDLVGGEHVEVEGVAALQAAATRWRQRGAGRIGGVDSERGEGQGGGVGRGLGCFGLEAGTAVVRARVGREEAEVDGPRVSRRCWFRLELSAEDAGEVGVVSQQGRPGRSAEEGRMGCVRVQVPVQSVGCAQWVGSDSTQDAVVRSVKWSGGEVVEFVRVF